MLLVEKIDAATQTVRQKLSSAKATDLLSYMKMPSRKLSKKNILYKKKIDWHRGLDASI